MRRVGPTDLPLSVTDAAATLGKLIAAVRKAHGQSQADLCAHAGIARSTLSEIEHGSPRVQAAHWLAALDSLGLLEGAVSGASAAAGLQLADVARPVRRRQS